jgi:tetratricopeptide (TPR) repeat protein
MMAALMGHTATLDSAEIHHLFSQAKDFFRRGNEAALRDPEAANGFYQQAVMRFERIVRDGQVQNGKLYYNIANAYFRMGDIGRAILHYRRAERFIPNDPNLRQNLDYARRHRVDKIAVKPETQVLKTLFFWHYDLATGTRLYLSCVLFGLTWVLAGIRLFARRLAPRWGIVLSALLAALLFGSLLVEEVRGRRQVGGVILVEEVVARKGDSETYQASFEEPLHAGTEFELIEERREWLHIELADGRRCWIPTRAGALVQRTRG